MVEPVAGRSDVIERFTQRSPGASIDAVRARKAMAAPKLAPAAEAPPPQPRPAEGPLPPGDVGRNIDLIA